MFANGVVEEVRKFWKIGPNRGQGARFARNPAAAGRRNFRTRMHRAIQQATRRYAKRQLTWFRRQTNFPAELISHGPAVAIEWILREARLTFAQRDDRNFPQKKQERALLIGLEQEGVSKWDLRDSMEELRELASSAGAEVVDTVTQKLQKPTAPYYIGKGKAELIKESFKDQQITSVIFNDELSPAQGRNLENLLSRKVLDRTQLILDIFAQRARSREGRLQIELAQLQYLLPRLTRMWDHLSRQTGGIGTRGPGETQLEVDRRRVQERIARLERELEGVRKVRHVQRQGRKRHQWPVAAVVGYTNAGKSTLLNLLTGADLVAENKLFATLDPTTRSLTLPNKQRVLLTDTVGFLRKLPHTLIESFKATLEEVSEADLLIHVIDLSHPRVDENIEAVNMVTKELGAYGKQTLLVFNKIDALSEARARSRLSEEISRQRGDFGADGGRRE